MEKKIELTLVNNKSLDVQGFGIHNRGQAKSYPEKVALSLLNNSTWERTKKAKEAKI